MPYRVLPPAVLSALQLHSNLILPYLLYFFLQSVLCQSGTVESAELLPPPDTVRPPRVPPVHKSSFSIRIPKTYL